MPAGAGLEFPYLEAIGGRDGRPRSAIARSLSRAQRTEVHDVWDQAHAWMTRWLDEHPEAPYQECADAVYLLARHGDSASEIYTRIRGAVDAFTRAGENTDAGAVDSALHWSLGEVRPCEFNAATSRAAALGDQTPDPQLAALIALAAVIRCPRYIRALDQHTVASDQPTPRPWGGVSRSRPSYDASSPPSTSTSAIRSALPNCDVPRQPARSHGPGVNPPCARRARRPGLDLAGPARDHDRRSANADGRQLLHSLTAWTLWLRANSSHA